MRFFSVFKRGNNIQQFICSCLTPDQVPYLNSSPVDSLASGTLVRYRCMVKDMFDPEYYMGVYEEVHQQTGQRVSFRIIFYV